MIGFHKSSSLFAPVFLLAIGLFPITSSVDGSISFVESTGTEVIEVESAVVETGSNVSEPAQKVGCGLYAHSATAIPTMDCYSDVYTNGEGETCYICTEAGKDNSCEPCGGGLCIGDQVEEGN